MGIVIELFKGKDGTALAAKIRCTESDLERAVQRLYPMELHRDRKYSNCMKTNKVNDNDPEQKTKEI